MNWFVTTNNRTVDINDIPCLDMDTLRQEILDIKKRVVGFFGKREWNGVRLFVVMADDMEGKFYVSSAFFDNNGTKEYQSITPIIPAFHMFEREFYEDFGIKPVNHPWLKPVRDHKKEYPFF